MIDRIPTRAELAIFARFERTIIRGRAAMAGYLGACDCLGQIEQWRRGQIEAGMISADLLPVMFSEARVTEAEQRAIHWNILENGLSGLQLKTMGFQVAPNAEGNPDIDIYMKPAELNGPLVLLVIGASVVIGGIITALAVIKANQDNARQAKKDLAFLNQRMSAAPAPVRDAFITLQKTQAYQQPKTLWDKISGSFQGVGMIALVIAGAFLLSRRGEPTDRAPVNNPCGGTAPEEWNVNWTDDDDPKTIDRQLDHVLSSMSPSQQRKWSDHFYKMRYHETKVPF